MITVKNNCFHLATASTSYVFLINQRGQAEHLYYGPRLSQPELDTDALRVKKSVPRQGEVSLSQKAWETNVTDMPLEVSTQGQGDSRLPFISIRPRRNCSSSLDLRYRTSETFKGVRRMDCGLPQAIAGEEEAHGLRLDLVDPDAGLLVSLYYTLFPTYDTITRRTTVKNIGSDSLELASLASLQLDLPSAPWTLCQFQGPWGRECREHRQRVDHTMVVNESRNGFTGQNANTVILEKDGESIIIALLYSGDHRESVEATQYGITHVLCGLNCDTTRIVLKPGESFEGPEAVLTSASERTEAVSRLHLFQTNCLMRGTWRNRLRPVTYNTRLSMGLDVKEDRLIQEIRLAGKLGFEMFVLDDGWFGVRNDRDDSVGDWSANTMKIPSGIAGISKECHKNGMLFGLWISAECVSRQSRLALEHPDWLARSPRRKDSPVEDGQFLLDITRPEVYDYLLDSLKSLVERTGIDCIRWNLGTQMADVWSRCDDESQTGSWRHRYMLAFYRLQKSLTNCFPNLLIENTSSSSPRIDSGLLATSGLLQATVLSDPFEQLDALISAGMIIPPSCISTTIAPRRWNLESRHTSFSSAFNIGIFGSPSWSVDLRSLDSGERKAIADQINFYKLHRQTLQFGRRRLIEDGNRVILSAASSDGEEIIVLYALRSMIVNAPDDIIRVPDADGESVYSFSRRDEESELFPGEDYYTSPSYEEEAYIITGDTLARAGVRLISPYSGGIYSEGMRVMGDHSTRLYVVRRVARRSEQE